MPVTDYASEIWGYKKYDFLDRLQFRAARTVLGVGKRAPLPYLAGDICLLDVQSRNHRYMIRLWTRIISMSRNRNPRKVYLWDRESSTKNSWSSEVKSILTKCDQIDCFRENTTNGMNANEFVDSIKQKLLEYCATKWKTDVEGMPKLRTYVEIKDCYRQEPIVCKYMSSKQRGVISKLRNGTLPIAIETGRFRKTPLQERLCGQCNNQSIEDEKHVLLHCNAYLLERQRMLAKIAEKLDIPIF